MVVGPPWQSCSDVGIGKGFVDRCGGGDEVVFSLKRRWESRLSCQEICVVSVDGHRSQLM
jgi:hypothetical protein